MTWFPRPEVEDKVLYIELKWTSGSGSGMTTSGLFAIASNSTEADKLTDNIKQLLDQDRSLEEGLETINAPNGQGGPTSGPITAGGPSATSSIFVSGLPSATLSPGANAAPAGSSAGLSTGAIAGIAVACGIVGLAVVGFLAWFFCLRRSRRGGKDHVHDAPYSSDGAHGAGQHHHDYMLDKEAHAVVADSPHSPYSDEAGALGGGAGRSRNLTGGAGAGPVPAGYFHPESGPVPHSPEHDGHGSYHGYSDAAATGHAATAADGTRSATPQHVPDTVAHLVEDGMTEDQIRRLEEEERALDEAIARSGRR